MTKSHQMGRVNRVTMTEYFYSKHTLKSDTTHKTYQYYHSLTIQTIHTHASLTHTCICTTYIPVPSIQSFQIHLSTIIFLAFNQGTLFQRRWKCVHVSWEQLQGLKVSGSIWRGLLRKLSLAALPFKAISSWLEHHRANHRRESPFNTCLCSDWLYVLSAYSSVHSNTSTTPRLTKLRSNRKTMQCPTCMCRSLSFKGTGIDSVVTIPKCWLQYDTCINIMIQILKR